MRLTEKDDQGNWCLKGVRWEQLRVGQVLTKDVAEKLYGALFKLMAYENTKCSPGDVENFIELSANLIKLVAEYVKKCRWIPVEEKLPEDGTYLTTLNGELVGQKELFTGMCGIENGKWDEEGCVIAWMPLPEPYREKEKPAAGVGWKGHYRGRFEKIE